MEREDVDREATDAQRVADRRRAAAAAEAENRCRGTRAGPHSRGAAPRVRQINFLATGGIDTLRCHRSMGQPFDRYANALTFSGIGHKNSMLIVFDDCEYFRRRIEWPILRP